VRLDQEIQLTLLSDLELLAYKHMSTFMAAEHAVAALANAQMMYYGR